MVISLQLMCAREKINCFTTILPKEPQQARLTLQEPHREVMQRQVCA